MSNRIKNFIKNSIHYIILAVKRYNEDAADSLASHISLNLLLSFFPIMVFLLTLAGYSPIEGDQVIALILDFIPTEAHTLMKNTIYQVLDHKNPTLLSLSLLTTMYGASRGFKAILLGLNIAYDVDENRGFIVRNLLAIFFTFAIVLLVIGSLLLLVLGQTIWDFIENMLDLPDNFFIIWTFIRYAGMFSIMYITFAILYAKSSAIKLPFKTVRYGTLFTTISWFVVSYGFSFYVDNFGNYANIYGGIAGLFIMILWLNLMSSVILFGGELNAAIYYKNPGKRRHLR
ncbi:YihY/virulence factor BrkB family protein [Clostridium cellulovorans]|uniref:Ribonuclease BN n=1 Tax=Clostridium cellulovorans (strain ATCC 35296 / DSM 3052 / OCM 3 / 743B) TaxID=573061 RepID=D9SVQ5_CLOC7|nr:YhjD/YihY/BrkB family envelope integrity protein [Clostridium cellulovorans]ADL53116.1 ribonuclease BN [Clostridium cellulovorans 743B]